jgi:hypothetical protein
VEETEIPDSWRQALQAQDDARAAKPKFKRRPIQPTFRFWPWGAVGVLAPLVALALASSLTISLRLPWPNLLAGASFYAVLGALQAVVAGRAIDPDTSSVVLLWRGAWVGVFAVLALLIPGAAEVVTVFLFTFVAARLAARLGLITLLFVATAETVAMIFFATVQMMIQAGLVGSLAVEGSVLTTTLVLAYPVLNGAVTALFPVERTLFARLDASFAGIVAALQAMFAALVLYRTVCFVLMLAGCVVPLPFDDLVPLAAAPFALAVGNAICVWILFQLAYSAREDALKEEAVRDVAERERAEKKRRAAEQATL